MKNRWNRKQMKNQLMIEILFLWHKSKIYVFFWSEADYVHIWVCCHRWPNSWHNSQHFSGLMNAFCSEAFLPLTTVIIIASHCQTTTVSTLVGQTFDYCLCATLLVSFDDFRWIREINTKQRRGKRNPLSPNSSDPPMKSQCIRLSDIFSKHSYGLSSANI